VRIGYIRTSKKDLNNGGRKQSMYSKSIALTSKLTRERETPISEVYRAVWGSKATLYRC
jgi:hypothetical protein